MKNQAIRLTALLFGILPFMVTGQIILTGQNSGLNIVYHDIDDLYIASPFWNSSDYEYMDLDDDGNNDLMLLNDFIYYSHTNQMSVHSGITALGQLQYSSLADSTAWIRKHPAGDVIDKSLNWSPGSGILFNQWDAKGSSGAFQGEGYLVFRICKTDTVYGWIRMYNDASQNGAYMSVYEFAYVTNFTGLSPSDDDFSPTLSNDAKGRLIVSIPEISGRNFRLKCFDLAGRMVFQASPGLGTNHCDISGFEPGLYIFFLSDQQGNFITKKAIVAGYKL